MTKLLSSLCLFKPYADYIMQNARLDDSQAGIKIARRNISNLRYADDATLKAESEEKLYCHPAYLTDMQSTYFKMSGWMTHKLESRLPGEIPTTSVMQMIPL